MAGNNNRTHRNSRLKDMLIGAIAASALWLGGIVWENLSDDVVYHLEKSRNPSCYSTTWSEQVFCNPEGDEDYFLSLESFLDNGRLNEEFRDYLTRYPHQIDTKTAFVKELEVRIKFEGNPKKLYGLK